MIDHYDWAGGREAMTRFGPDHGPVVIALLPLLEEANRTRAFVVTLMRLLGERGVGSVLPDLPATGESLLPTERLSVTTLAEAVEQLAGTLRREGRSPYSFAVRSGALTDAFAELAGRWHFAPQEGADLQQELRRQKQAGSVNRLGPSWFYDLADPDGTIEIAGNRLRADFVAALEDQSPCDTRTAHDRVVRLESDPRPADLKLPGTPLWRRAEPDNDPALAARLADDLAAWVRACEG